MLRKLLTIFTIPAWTLCLAGCPAQVGGYDPQCALDVAQECVEQMEDCRVEEKPAEGSETDAEGEDE